jgi:hypothetical protein
MRAVASGAGRGHGRAIERRAHICRLRDEQDRLVRDVKQTLSDTAEHQATEGRMTSRSRDDQVGPN